MRKEIKNLAKSQLKGRWASAIAAFLIITIVNIAIGYSLDFVDESIAAIILINILSVVVASALSFGAATFILNFIDGKNDIKDIFSGFRIILKVLGLTILMGLIIMLGTVLLIIPGIIASLMLSQSYFVLAENPDKGIVECMKDSKNLMKGRLWEYFVLELSFLGWILLSIFTCGIGLIWLTPYQNITFGNYYRAIKESSEINKFYE